MEDNSFSNELDFAKLFGMFCGACLYNIKLKMSDLEAISVSER
jgi:hypothetical protein